MKYNNGEFGTDLKWDGEDILPSLEITNTELIVIEAISRRLQASSGSLYYDLDYGFNLESLLKAPTNINESEIQAEVLKDERVSSCKCKVIEDVANEEINIRLQVQLDDGLQFTLVFSLNEDSGLETAYERL